MRRRRGDGVERLPDDRDELEAVALPQDGGAVAGESVELKRKGQRERKRELVKLFENLEKQEKANKKKLSYPSLVAGLTGFAQKAPS